MSLKFCEFQNEHIELVKQFNERMRAAGSYWQFYDDPVPTWLPKSGEGADLVWREFYLAIENNDRVCGSFILKPQQFRVAGKDVRLASWQGPISEGIVDKKYNMLGFLLLREIERREPRLIGWGPSQSLRELLERLKWPSVGTPVLLDVVHPYQFLRQSKFLRTSGTKRLACDLLAFTGLGWATIAAARLRSRWKSAAKRQRKCKVTIETRFGDWADSLWRAVADQYAVVAERSAATLNRIMPEGDWPDATILRLENPDDHTTVGWIAVRLKRLENDKRFGNMLVGSLIDFLAVPGWETAVVAQGQRHLRSQGADVLVSNMSHPAWVSAFQECGFLAIKNRRSLCVSPKLASALDEPFEQWVQNTHLTLIDGDGPLGL